MLRFCKLLLEREETRSGNGRSDRGSNELWIEAICQLRRRTLDHPGSETVSVATHDIRR